MPWEIGGVEWKVSLLGTPEIHVAGEPVALPRTRKALSLLALLLLEAGRGVGVVDRVTLAEQLWPDSDAEAGATNLRQTLAILRRSLGKAAEQIEAPTKSTLRLNPTGLTCDLYIFDTAMAREDYATAAVVYRGALLPGTYDDWLLPERQRREHACLAALLHLSAEAATRSDTEAARQWAERAVALAPLDEPAQRQLYTAYAAEGNLAAARSAFQRFRVRLREEQQLSPSAETLACLSALVNAPAVSRGRTPHKDTTPRFLTTFIGRAEALAELRMIAARPDTRLLTLLGLGGMGKTRLAVELAQSLNGEAIPFVDLSPLPADASEDALYTAIAAVLELPLSPTLTAREAIAVVPPENWLILDNAETVQAACATVAAELLCNCPKLRLLVTSRQVLGIPGEIRWAVPALTEEEATQLFRIRADAVRPGMNLTDAEVAELCERLDGMPLALELAAGRLNVLTPAQLRGGLDRQSLRLLKNTEALPSAVPSRHATLQATIQGSWELLTESQQTLLAQLSLFAGGWTLDAAYHILFPEADEWYALDRLEELANRSLVSVRGERGFLLDTIREFARERLAVENEAEVQERFARYYLQLARQDSELALLPTERSNLHAALERAEPGTALQLYVALGEYFLRGGHFEDGRRFGKALLAATAPNHPDRPWAFYEAGRLAQAQNDLDAAQALFAAGLSASAESNPVRIRLMGNLGLLERGRGNLAGAELVYAEAVRLAEQNGDRKALVTLGIRQAILAGDLGNLDEAVHRFETLLASLDDADDGSRAIVLGLLGGYYYRFGDVPRAMDAFCRALPLHERYGYQSEIARVCLGLGRCLISLGADASQAEAFLVRAWDTYQQLGDHAGVSQVAPYLENISQKTAA